MWNIITKRKNYQYIIIHDDNCDIGPCNWDFIIIRPKQKNNRNGRLICLGIISRNFFYVTIWSSKAVLMLDGTCECAALRCSNCNFSSHFLELLFRYIPRIRYYWNWLYCIYFKLLPLFWKLYYDNYLERPVRSIISFCL